MKFFITVINKVFIFDQKIIFINFFPIANSKNIDLVKVTSDIMLKDDMSFEKMDLAISRQLKELESTYISFLSKIKC